MFGMTRIKTIYRSLCEEKKKGLIKTIHQRTYRSSILQQLNAIEPQNVLLSYPHQFLGIDNQHHHLHRIRIFSYPRSMKTRKNTQSHPSNHLKATNYYDNYGTNCIILQLHLSTKYIILSMLTPTNCP